MTSLDICLPGSESDGGRVDWQEVLPNALPFVDVFAPSIDELLFMLDRPARDRSLAARRRVVIVLSSPILAAR